MKDIITNAMNWHYRVKDYDPTKKLSADDFQSLKKVTKT